MNGAVVISWGQGIPGREQKGLEVFGKAVAYYEELAKQGRIHAHREYFAIDGPASGFMLIEGDLDELLKIQAEPESIALRQKAAMIVQNLRSNVLAGGSDETIQQMMTNYAESLQELGYR